MKTLGLFSVIFSSFLTISAYAKPLQQVVTSSWVSEEKAGVQYQIYVPASAMTKAPSLMMSLHGCAQKNTVLQQYGNWEKTAEKYNMVVVLPAVPGGGVLLGCWSYYGANHSDSSGHSGALVGLAEALVQDASLNIDSSKVFISGLSSGAGEAFVVGCLRPDIFSGVGLNATPILGSGSSDIYSAPSKSPKQVADLCVSMAGEHASAFATQKTSIIYDSKDPLVNYQHDVVAAKTWSVVYGAEKEEAFDLATLEGANKKGTGLFYKDLLGNARVSVIMNTGLGHAWPSGKGGSTTSYVNANSIDYPAYLGEFFVGESK